MTSPQLCDDHLCDGGHGRSQRPAPLEEDGDPQGECIALTLKAVPLFSPAPRQPLQASPAAPAHGLAASKVATYSSRDTHSGRHLSIAALVPDTTTQSSLVHSEPLSQGRSCLHLLMRQDTQSLQGTPSGRNEQGRASVSWGFLMLYAQLSPLFSSSSILLSPRKRMTKTPPQPQTVTSSAKTTTRERNAPSCLCVSLGLLASRVPRLCREVPGGFLCRRPPKCQFRRLGSRDPECRPSLCLLCIDWHIT